MNTETAEKKTPHSLLSLGVKPVRSFEEWRGLWDSAEHAITRLGLIHAMQVDEMFWFRQYRAQTVSFLLDIADGFLNSRVFCADDREWRDIEEKNDFCRMEPYQFKQMIADRAFNILCLKFFKAKDDDKHGRPESSWAWIMRLEHIELIRKVLWFFRVEEIWGEGRIRNTPKVNNAFNAPKKQRAEIIKQFLEDFSKLCFRLEYYSPDEYKIFETIQNEQFRLFILSIQPTCVDFLEETENLDWLLGIKIPWDQAELIKWKLTVLALEKKCSMPRSHYQKGSSDYRKPESIYEAVLGGSKAANVLVIYRIMEKLSAKFKKLYDASCQERDELERKRRLASIEAEALKLEERQRELRRELRQ